MQTIHHRYPNQATLSKFDYTYDAVGNILTWRQQADSTAVQWAYGYDAADQLIRAVKWSTDPTPAVLQRYGYGYDPAGNRTHEQIDDTIVAATHDNLNRLLTHSPGGPIAVAGTTNEPATVTIQGRPAVADPANAFRGTTSTAAGTNTFTVTAVDPNGNQAIRQDQVPQGGAGKTFTYDADGNLASDGTRTFGWDARNQLVAVAVGTHSTEFTYDGEQRRVRIVEKEDGVTQSDSRVVLCDEELCEERAADGATVTRRVFGAGEQSAGSARFFAADHLGSLTEVVDMSAMVLSRYAFDPWGRRTLVAGIDEGAVGFTGHRAHTSGGLALAMYRGYEAGLGRWITEDPIGVYGGVNLYAYVANRPVREVDLRGLKIARPCGFTFVGAFGLIGDYNNQVIFCAECPKCKTRKINGVRWDGQLLTGPGEQAAGLAGVPSPSGPTIDTCGCSEANKVYVNIQTRRALTLSQFMRNAARVTLDFECQSQ